MVKNVGSMDRIIRGVVAVVALWGAFTLGVASAASCC